MAKETGIAWCDSTANLWKGCQKVSPACDHCYAEQLCGARLAQEWGPHADRTYVKAGWALIEQMQRRAERNGGVDPELGRRRRIFVNSLSDTFDNHPSILWRDAAFALMARSKDVDLILVTKRPQNVVKMVPWSWKTAWPAHIWLLTTAENQVELNRRGYALSGAGLQHVPVRGLSIEPALDWLDLTRCRPDATMSINLLTGGCDHLLGMHAAIPALNWIIYGEESGGSKARHSPAGLGEHLRDQCAEAGVPFFFKQTRNKGQIPDHLMVREFPA